MTKREENLLKIRNDRKEQLAKMDKRIAAGESVKDVCKDGGMHFTTYYAWKKRFAKKVAKPKVPKHRKVQPTLTEIPVAETPFQGGRIFALVGAPKEIMEAIRSLQ